MATDPLDQIRDLVELDPKPVQDTYRIAIQEREKFQTFRWMKQFQEQTGPSAEPAQPAGAGSTAGQAPEVPGPARTTGEIVMDVAKDVGKGITEAPRQALGGAIDALSASVVPVLDQANKVLDEGAGRALTALNRAVLGEEGAAELQERFKTEFPALAAAQGAELEELPTTAEATTVTGAAVRSLTQFLTGFAAGAKAIGGVKTAGQAIGVGAVADFAAFDGHEERLSDLIQEVPELANPVTAFLASDEEDTEIEGRLKNVLEGLGGDAVFAGVLRGLRAIKEARAAKEAAGGGTFAQLAERAAVEAGGSEFPALRPTVDLRPIVGDADAPSFRVQDIETGVPDDVVAKSAATAGTRVGDKEVFINFARINSTDDVKALVGEMADAFAGDIATAQRGTRSNKKTVQAAGDENAWKLLQERRKGETLNAEQTFAVRTLWASSGENLATASRAAADNPTPENLFAFRRAMALHSTIQKEALAVRTETARALQQWAIPAGGSTEAFRDIENVINIHGGTEVSSDLARRIAVLAEQGNQGAIDYITRKGALVSTLDAVREYWINSILSGPKTHMVNMVSNGAVALMSVVERAVAERIGDVLQGANRVQIGEAAAFAHGVTHAGRDAFVNAWHSLRTGETGFGVQKLEGPRVRSISTESLGNTSNETFNRVINTVPVARAVDAIGSVVTIPGRFLGAEDEFFKTINYRMEVHAQAFRQASEEVNAGSIPVSKFKERVAELTENPPESVRIDAADFAAYNTFTREPGEITKKIQGLAGKVPFGRYIVPFLNTPGNILKFTFERTPFAPISARFRADIAAGGARRDLALARMAVGSTTMLTAFDLAINGHITGSGPENPRERAALRRMGWQPYSASKDKKRYFAFNRLDPIGTILGFGADLAEYASNTDDDPNSEFEEAAMQTVLAAAENMMEKTYLYGFAQIVGAISDPGRFGVSYFERFAGSFVPTGVAEVARFNDPYMKHATSTIQKMKSRIPGLSRDVPNRHDLWGRPISFQSGLGPAYDAISPVYSSEFKPEPIDLELQRVGYFPGPPGKSIGVRLDGESKRVSLRNLPRIYQRYVVLTGGTSAAELGRPLTKSGKPNKTARDLDSYGDMSALEYLNSVVTGANPASEAYAAMNDEEKADFIGAVLSDYRAGARMKLLEEFPELEEFRARMDE